MLLQFTQCSHGLTYIFHFISFCFLQDAAHAIYTRAMQAALKNSQLVSKHVQMIVYRKQNFIISDTFMACTQRAKKVVSDSPGLLDFVIGPVNSVFNLPDRQVMFLSNSNKGKTVKSILLVKKLLGLVQMMSGLVNASFSLPTGQATKMIFFAPCIQQLNLQQKLQMFD